jgi:hypothetical protein
MVGHRQRRRLEVPKTILRFVDREELGLYRGSSQQTSSEVNPFTAMYQWYALKRKRHTSSVRTSA